MTTPSATLGPDAIKFLREEIRYENQQIANRVNYLSAVQSFLFVAFAISSAPSSGFWGLGRWALPLLGMLTSALALAGIVAAWIQLTRYRRQLADTYARLQEDWPRVGASAWVNRFALLYPLCVPVVFFVAWLAGFVLVGVG